MFALVETNVLTMDDPSAGRARVQAGLTESVSRASAKTAVALYPSGELLSFAELDSAANKLARFLRGHGVRPGDTVAILMENNRHIHAAAWAARRIGVYYTLVNTHLTVAEVAYIIDDCEATVVLASRGQRGVCEELDRELSRGLPGLAILADDELDGWQRYPDCVAHEEGAPLDEIWEGQLLQYSAGSTGQPKGIRRPLAPTAQTAPSAPSTPFPLSTPVFRALGVGPDSVYLSPAPTYHTAPAMWTMAAQDAGATTVIMEQFDAEGALKCIEQFGVTHAQFVPTMFIRMLRLPDTVKRRYDLSSLKRVIHAAAPCPVEIKRQMIDWWGPIIDEYYGSSEGAGISFIRADDWLRHPGSVGRPILGVPHILGDDGRELEAGDIGDVFFEGGYDFDYLNDPEKTAAARSPQGWVTVGDVGYLDDEGYLFLTDRRHNMILSGGVNIYPQEAEHVLVGHPAVVDAAVFGIPDHDLGQSVMAVVELADPSAASDELAQELLAWVGARLSRQKCPCAVAFEKCLPRTDAGKLYKQSLIERYGG